MRHGWAAFGVAALLLATQPGCKKFKEAQANAAAKRDQDKVQAAAVLATFQQQLSAVQSHVKATPVSELREQRCPDQTIFAAVDAKKNYGKARLVTMTTTALDQIVSSGTVTRDPADNLGFMTSNLVAGLKLGVAKGGYDDNDYRATEMRKDSGHFIGVYRDVKSVSPRVVEKAGIVAGDNVFDGGSFDSWLVVYDTDTARPVCATHISAKNSDKVKWRDRGLLKTTFEKALTDDFVSEVKRESEASMKRISAKVALGT